MSLRHLSTFRDIATEISLLSSSAGDPTKNLVCAQKRADTQAQGRLNVQRGFSCFSLRLASVPLFGPNPSVGSCMRSRAGLSNRACAIAPIVHLRTGGLLTDRGVVGPGERGRRPDRLSTLGPSAGTLQSRGRSLDPGAMSGKRLLEKLKQFPA